MKVVGIIPARLASSRFPGKPLAKILGKPMIEHVYRRSKCAELIDELYIATCDNEIAAETEKFGGRFIMTSISHTRGTDRVAEAAEKIDADIIVNIQGDEPFVDPESLDKSIAHVKSSVDNKCVNWITPINDWNVFVNDNIVKAVIDRNKRILYFSRQPIPSYKKENMEDGYKQLGVYLFRKEMLEKYYSWEETVLEKVEKVDMLRIIENGFTIQAFLVKDMVGVDNPNDVPLVEQMLLSDLLYNKIFNRMESKKR